MLVEIPEPEIILGIVVAFFIGILVLYTIYKIKPSIKRRENFDVSSYDRLEFYERQLIDMKIRLDSLQIESEVVKSNEINDFSRDIEKIPNTDDYSAPKLKRHYSKPQQTPIIDHYNTVDFVLGLITDKSMTSRDIQNASQRSREHTSRLMKKLYKDGYVERDIKTKPFTYSITEKGKAKLGILDYLQNATA